MKNLTLIIPTKMEVESLPIFLKEIEKYECIKLIVIDSNDKRTLEVIKKIQGIEILIQKNNGYGNALIEGIEAVKTDYCCIINADGSMDPKYLASKLDLCRKNDFIFSSRYESEGGSDDDDFITFTGNKIFTFLGNIFFRLEISDILYTYVMAKSSSIKSLNLKSKDFRICVELPIKAKRNGYSLCSLASYERPRIGGSKKVSPFKDGFLILIELIRLFLKKKLK